MMLFTIPDLVWKQRGLLLREAETPAGFIELDFSLTRGYGQMLVNHKVLLPYIPTMQEAVDAANAWYKAKMAEGLKVATVEELRTALLEAEAKEQP